MFIKLLHDWLDVNRKSVDQIRLNDSELSGLINFATWLDENAAQQSVQADGACTCGELTIFDVEPCPVHGKGE